MTISKEDLTYALSCSADGVIAADQSAFAQMAEKMTDFCLIEKNPDSDLWSWNSIPEPPENEVESPIGTPPKPTD